MKITTARDLAAHLTDLCGGAQVLCVSEEEAREAMHSLGLTRYDELSAADIESVYSVVAIPAIVGRLEEIAARDGVLLSGLESAVRHLLDRHLADE